MKGGQLKTKVGESSFINSFEALSRNSRWYVILVIAALYPHWLSSSPIVYILLAVYGVLNLSRYSAPLMRQRWFAAPLTMLIAGNLFIAGLLYLANNPASLLQLFFVVPIIQAGYLYKLRGVLGVLAFQVVCVLVIVAASPFQPVILGETRAIILMVAVLLGLGVYVQQLTAIERHEKEQLEVLGRDLDTQRKHLLTLVDSMTDAIFVVDDHGRVQDYNTAALALSNETGDLHGLPFSRVLRLFPHTNPDADTVNLLKQAGPQHRRDLGTTTDHGGTIDLDIRVQPVKLDGQKSSDHIIVCKDVTKERGLDEQRTAFISVASHELRTPITIMEAALSAAMLSRDKLDVQTIAILAQAHRHCIYLSNLVKDLAVLAHASNDNIPAQLEILNLQRLFKELTQDFEAQARQKGLELQMVLEDDLPQAVSTENHIREILQNYINNAIKYSDEGRIIVRAEPSKKGGVVFSVHDTGPGISQADQRHLFEKFFRGGDYMTDQKGGTGLGLYLCRELAQRLNGRVWCESEPGKGSVFFLEIPHIGPYKEADRYVQNSAPATTGVAEARKQAA
jgi:signal transduction histidine kinase